jgi:hypothetical protein
MTLDYFEFKLELEGGEVCHLPSVKAIQWKAWGERGEQPQNHVDKRRGDEKCFKRSCACMYKRLNMSKSLTYHFR